MAMRACPDDCGRNGKQRTCLLHFVGDDFSRADVDHPFLHRVDGFGITQRNIQLKPQPCRQHLVQTAALLVLGA